MKLFGLTGGIGMGKSTAGEILYTLGYPVIDTDTIARELAQPGQPALNEIVETFGTDLLSGTGELRRDVLAKIVFADVQARKKLEAILHPRIRDRWQSEVERWRRKNINYGFVIIPLLFETEAAHFFDAVVCLACTSETQQMRLLARGWSEEQIAQRIASQMSVERKISLADYVIWTETTREAHAAQWQRLLSQVN